MKTIRPLPLATFSQVDYPIELENMFDYQQNQTLTPYGLDDNRAYLSFTGAHGVTVGSDLYVSITSVESGNLVITEYLCNVDEITTTILVSSVGSPALPEFSTEQKVSYRKAVATTPKDVTFGLQPSGGTLAEFKIRANSQGKGLIYIGEILRTYLPEFIAPKDYEETAIDKCAIPIEILFNGQEDNFINVFYGAKFIPNDFYTTAEGRTPLGSFLKVFQEQLIGYITLEAAPNLQRRFFTADYEVGQRTVSSSGTTSTFNLYPAIPCRKKIYLSANYGLLPDGELIDVSVPVLAFINRAGQYEYIRFTGSNVNKYNVQEARLKQDYAGTITNADTGLIYEGIELTLADDNENTDFPYLIDKLELQRCKALLMESPKAWLLVNGELQQCLEVRVKRESVRFATSFDKSRDNFTAQCEVIVCQPLGNPQY